MPNARPRWRKTNLLLSLKLSSNSQDPLQRFYTLAQILGNITYSGVEEVTDIVAAMHPATAKQYSLTRKSTIGVAKFAFLRSGL